MRIDPFLLQLLSAVLFANYSTWKSDAFGQPLLLSEYNPNVLRKLNKDYHRLPHFRGRNSISSELQSTVDVVNSSPGNNVKYPTERGNEINIQNIITQNRVNVDKTL